MNKIECLSCHGLFERNEMHTGRDSESQTCIKCHAKIKHDNAMKTKNHRKETMIERNKLKEIERAAKAEKLADDIVSGAKSSVISRESKRSRARTHHAAMDMQENLRIAKDMDIEVSDFL